MSSALRRERSGDVLVLTLSAEGRRNALSRVMARELAAAVTGVDPSVLGVVVTGADGTFSAGADFRDITGTSADLEYDDDVAAAVTAITNCPVPVVAALEGPVMGASAHLALSCDLRIAGEGSFIQVPAVRLGLLYSPRAVRWLSQRFPRDSVRRLMLLAERFDAAGAREAGLVTSVVPGGRALESAIAALGGQRAEDREAVAFTRALLAEVEADTYDDATWQARRRALLDSPSRAEAVRSAKARHDSN